EASAATATDDASKKWTVIGPDGQVMTFGSWEELIRAPRPSVITTIGGSNLAPSPSKTSSEPSASTSVTRTAAKTDLTTTKISGSALLDVTPMPTASLTLAEDSDANVRSLVSRAKTEIAKTASEEKAPDSIEELDPKALVDDHSDDEEAPLSL